MRKKWFLVLCSLGLVFIFPICMIISTVQSASLKPKAQMGYLDLSGWDFKSGGKVDLKGEWEFYRSQLLAPEDFNSKPGKESAPGNPHIVHVPGEWNSYISADGKPASKGYGTYRLRIRLNTHSDNDIYGIQTSNIRMSNRVFVNGHEVGASGNPSSSSDTRSSGNIPFTSFVPLTGDQVEIVVQVANYSYSSGGIITPIGFGDGLSISRSYQANLLEDVIMGVGFLLFSMHFFYIFRNRKHEYASLSLSGLCLAGLIYVLTHGQKLIGVIMPGLSYEITLKIQLITSTMVYFFLVRYVAASLPQVIPKRLLALSNLLTLTQVIVATVLPARIFSEWDIAIVAYGLICVCYLFYAMLRGMKLHPGHSLLMLTGGLSILSIIILKLFNVIGVLESDVFVIYEILLFVAVQTLLLSKRFTDSYREVEDLSSRLITLDGLKDEFMVNTSHELRTPIHAIVNITESMIGGIAGPLNPGQAEHLSMVASTGKRLSLLIEGLLDFTRLRAGDIKLELKPVNLPAAVTLVWEVISLTIGKRNIRLVQNYPDDLPPVYMDENRLQQVLFKLLSNAVKYTEQGEIRVYAVVESEGVTFSVADTGIGMTQENVEELTQLFSGKRSQQLNEYNGTGLGLRVTWELVHLAGGRMAVESGKDFGSVFHVSLPAAEEADRREFGTAVELAASGSVEPATKRIIPVKDVMREPDSREIEGHEEEQKKFTVLIVDDDIVNLKVLNNLLYMEKYRVITAENGQEALEEVARNPRIDLVILDWMMPGMSGIELCQLLRERFILSELPILMLTARSSPEDIQAGFQAGINDFLSKPVNAVELRARVRTLLELRQSVQTAVRTEMAFLQAQIKPHFLYNALNTMIALCPVDPDKTMRLLLELSQYLRGSFDFHNRDQFVPLQKELELIESYIYLEKARFEDRLQMEYLIEGDLKVMIPPLSIQPIVENAVRHGIMERAAGGTVSLQISVTQDKIRVVVTDNGVGMEPEKLSRLLSGRATHRGVGLINIHERLKTLNRSGLDIESRPGQGTRVSFELSRAAFM